MEKSTDSDRGDDEFPPKKRLEAPNHRLIEAGIATIPDMETLQECVAYENGGGVQIRMKDEAVRFLSGQCSKPTASSVIATALS
ncbi:hypothetical protein [Haloplanus halobius]|uniref:hypothetical protein n=1 Tax=Haloplanus halobius TaxID=2934938 RepID=UPI00200FE142|nr:hypothetical protein [Haloplanus sp. XH21]